MARVPPAAGDQNKITIGSFSNIQDRAVITALPDETEKWGPAELPNATEIGSHVTVGHGAVLHSCIVQDNATIGMGAVVLEGAVVEQGAMVGAGSVVPPGRRVPARQLWAGNPAKYVRDVSDHELESNKKSAQKYSELQREHSDMFEDFGTQFRAHGAPPKPKH